MRDVILSFIKKLQIIGIFCTMLLQILIIICTGEKKTNNAMQTESVTFRNHSKQ